MLSSGVTALMLWSQMIESVKNINRLHAGSEKKGISAAQCFAVQHELVHADTLVLYDFAE